jgi:hypothetical protein
MIVIAMIADPGQRSRGMTSSGARRRLVMWRSRISRPVSSLTSRARRRRYATIGVASRDAAMATTATIVSGWARKLEVSKR